METLSTSKGLLLVLCNTLISMLWVLLHPPDSVTNTQTIIISYILTGLLLCNFLNGLASSFLLLFSTLTYSSTGVSAWPTRVQITFNLKIIIMFNSFWHSYTVEHVSELPLLTAEPRFYMFRGIVCGLSTMEKYTLVLIGQLCMLYSKQSTSFWSFYQSACLLLLSQWDLYWRVWRREQVHSSPCSWGQWSYHSL